MPIGGGRLLFIFCYQKTTKMETEKQQTFFSIEIYKTICHTLKNVGGLGLLDC